MRASIRVGTSQGNALLTPRYARTQHAACAFHICVSHPAPFRTTSLYIGSPVLDDDVDMIGTILPVCLTVTQTYVAWLNLCSNIDYKIVFLFPFSHLHAFMILAPADTSSRGGALEPVQMTITHVCVTCSWRRVVFFMPGSSLLAFPYNRHMLRDSRML